MNWTPWSDLRLRAAALFATVAIGAAIASGAAALREDVVAPAPPYGAAPAFAPQPAHVPAARASLEGLDPFGLADAASPVGDSAPPAAAPDIVLVGTIIGAEQPAAVCRLGDAPARILHVGDTLGGWRLAQVAPGQAVFIDAGGVRHKLRLSPLGN